MENVESVTSGGGPHAKKPKDWRLDQAELADNYSPGIRGFGLISFRYRFHAPSRIVKKNEKLTPDGKKLIAPVSAPAKLYVTPNADWDLIKMLCRAGNKMLAHCRANVLVAAQLNEKLFWGEMSLISIQNIGLGKFNSLVRLKYLI